MEKKEYYIASSINDGFLEIAITGTATGRDHVKIVNEFDEILKANRVKKAIFDVRGLAGRIENMEIYRFVRNHPSVIYDIQSAIVDFPENNHQETAAKNAGLALWKWFTDLDSARAWLKASKR
ncbi:MAG: hypothetical protein PHH96_04595 [Smithellaceae bacterium]|jgi:hypothetical protein|nr:hypothetical protein [Smithellaceae bacterium]HBL53744.1 hypothetical protein [Syntrophaceae bacterium]HCS76382.1 hypothetical protein [Syntrophaceae bacterium]HCX02314.1 hypothetical protein [Syntrophaceae bacterium]